MTRKPVLKHREDWMSGTDPWRGNIEGQAMDTNVTILFYATDEVGRGAALHYHPYDEVFHIRKGRALFTIGGERIEAEEGDVLMAPAEVPHKFHNLGPGRLETVDIHLNDRWIQTEVEDPEKA